MQQTGVCPEDETQQSKAKDPQILPQDPLVLPQSIWPEGDNLNDRREDQGQRRRTHSTHQRDDSAQVWNYAGQ